MTWDEWCQTYPCLEVFSLPEEYEDVYKDRPSAEIHRDKLEEGEDPRLYKVVKFNMKFYVVTK